MEIQESKVVTSYISGFRDLINYAIQSSEKPVKDVLKFNKPEDWNFVTIAMDVFEDAHAAIHNFTRYGTGGPTKISDIGERYLRLYGFLSAVYNQQEAVKELYIRMNVPNPKIVKKKIGSLQIRTLRHKLASHSTNYKDENETKGAFAPTRIELEDYSISTYSYTHEEFFSYDLIEELKEHFEYMIQVLDELYVKSYKTIYKHNPQKLDKFDEKLKDLRIEKEGGIVLRTSDNDNKVVITYVSTDKDS